MAELVVPGQTEPAATNAPVGSSVHWMGCDFSFDVRWVHHSPFLFAADHCSFVFGGFVLSCFSPEPDLKHNNPTHLPMVISTLPTLVPYQLY